MCACAFHLPYQTGSSLRADNGFESSPNPRYQVVQGWAQRGKVGRKEERKAPEERKGKRGRTDPGKNPKEAQAPFDPAVLPDHLHPHLLCRCENSGTERA